MKCPRCGNDGPADAPFCGVCYEVLAKKASQPAAASVAAAATPPSGWTPAIIASALVAFFVLIPLRNRLREALWVLDMVNLAFHEAGHPIFGILGLGNHWITVWGGTLMQLIMPGAAAFHFYARGEKASACACVWWFGQNFLYIGNYMADARAQVLPLLGGGEHDWTYLFETMRVLPHDVQIGAATQILGCLIMAFALAGIYVYYRRPNAE